MIFANVNLYIGENESICDHPITLYRGDRNVQIRFILKDNKFSVAEQTYAQLIINRPSSTSLFTDYSIVENNAVVLTISGEMIDEIKEIGTYQFQIRLFDDDLNARVTLPPCYGGLIIEHPIAIEEENVVNVARINDAIVTASEEDTEEIFTDDVYNTTEWIDGDIISDTRMNKIESAIYTLSTRESGGGAPYISTMLSENIMVETDNDFTLTIDFASKNQGRGTLKVFINDIDSVTTQVEQGTSNTVISHELLSKGTNKVVVYVIDRLGTMSNSLTFYVRYGGTEVVGDFDSSISYEVGSTIRYYFIPTALDTSLSLTFYMSIDGTTQTGIPCYSDVRGYFTFPNNLDVGAHYCEAWVEDSNGGKSNVLIFNLILLDATSLVVSSDTKSAMLEEGAQLSLEYRVYMHNNTSFITKTYVDDELVNTGTCTLAPAYYKSSNLPEGIHTIKVEVFNLDETVSDYVTWTVIITPSTYTMLEPVNAGAIFIASAKNRTNSDEDRESWIGHNQDGTPIEGTLFNFAFNNESGWVDDTILVTGRSHIEVPIKPLLNNAKYGFTLDIEFLTKPIGVDNAEVLNLWDDVNNCGIKITTEELIMQSKTGNRCDLYFTEDQIVSAIFVIDRNEKTAKIYLNGVMCEAFALSDYTLEGQAYLEDFTVDKTLILGGENRNGYSAIKNLRIYDIALTTDEILNNFMCNETDKMKQRELAEFQKGEDLPTITVYCDFSGLGKNDKKPCDIFYNSPDVTKYGESFALQGKTCQLQYQGTSSMAYPIKNYRLNLRDENGDKWYYPFPESQPECRFCLKADFMSSGHWSNTGLTKWINNNLYNYDYSDEKTMNPAKWWAIQNGEDPNNYRECINGFPCRLILVNDGDTPLNVGQNEPLPGNTKDMGVFNFNLDKDCENSLGFTIADFPESISMEVTANSDTSAGAFISYANSGVTDISELDYIKQSFELRYGDGDEDIYGFLDINGDTSKGIKRVIDWVDNCTDEEFVNDFEQYFHKDYTFRYYLLVITLGMVDNLGKNMMLDSYDGKIWMPRFYDCDTICSYDNSGQLKFDVDIEMEQGYWNTSSSRLWTRLRDLFHDELIEKYNNMRQHGMSYESFMNIFYDEQIAKIPQRYYNMDFDVKYGPFINQYAGMAHGDTYEHLKRWLKNRLIFTDSLFDYAPSYTNDMLTIRANTTELMSLTIETYTPVYQHVSFYNGHMAKEKISKGQTFTFSGYAQAATDQEVLIYGGSNVKRITGISTMNPNSMLIGGATRLVELDISNCPLLTTINSNKANLSVHTYLNKLDISNCPQLGGILMVNNSPLLQSINAENTAITALMLPSTIRNLESLKLPNTITELTLNDGNMLEEIEFQDGVVLEKVSMINCNSIERITNFDLTAVTDLTLNNSYSIADELVMSATTSLNLSNMNNLKRLIFTPNCERETFNHTQLKNDPVYTITTFNCPMLTTFITTAPQRLSYVGDETEIRPNSIFSASTLDISNTQIDTVKFLCTTDINTLKLPSTINNFYCDSAYDIDTNVVSDASYEFTHGDLIDAYCTNYTSNVGSYDIIPSSSDGSLIFSIYAPLINSAIPNDGVWDLYGLAFKDFYTYGMNNDICYSNGVITMPERYTSYNVTIKNADINPVTLPTMLYPSLINEDIPIVGILDYSGYEGTSLDYAFAYTDTSEVDINLPLDVILNVDSMHNVVQDSNFTIDDPRMIAKYITNTKGVLPNFNPEYTEYFVIENDLGDGTYEVVINSITLGDEPTNISFNGQTALLSVEHLKVTSSVTNMSNMFSSCNLLTSVNTTGWDTSKVTNMASMFCNCNTLTSLDVSNFDTSNVTNMASMFQNCNALTSLDLSNWDTSSVTTMHGMFSGCNLLTSVNTTGWDTSSVTTMAYMFYNCNALTSLDVSNWNTSNVRDMGYMFYNCNALTSLDVSNWNTSNVMYMTNMFSGCKILTNLDVSNFDTSSVTNMYGMFSGCNLLTSVNTTGWDTSSVTTMAYMFYNCNALTTLDVSNWDTSSVTNMAFMIYKCKALTNLDISGFITSNVTTMESMFQDCNALTSLDVSNWDTSNVTNMAFMFAGCKALTTLNVENWPLNDITQTAISSLPTGDDERNDIYAYFYFTVPSGWNLINAYEIAKYTCNTSGVLPTFNSDYTGYSTTEADNGDGTYTTRIMTNDLDVIPTHYRFDNIKSSLLSVEYLKVTSSVTSMYFMFDRCSLLTSVNTTGWDTSNVTNMQTVFRSCGSLTSLDVSNFVTLNVTNMANMFYGCNALTSLDVSNFDTSNVTSMNSMFNGCGSLTSLDLSNWVTSKVTDMGSMFYNCNKLTSLDASNWDTSSVTSMWGMFYNCSTLTSLDASNWVTSKVTSMASMFQNCNALTSLDASNWDTSSVTSMWGMFLGCNTLTTLNVEGWPLNDITQTAISSLPVGDDERNDIYAYFYFTVPSGWNLINAYEIAKYTCNTSGVLPTFNSDYTGYSTTEADNGDGTYTTRIMTNDLDVMPTNISFNGKKSLLSVEHLKVTSSVTSMSNMFSSCNLLTSVNTTGWDTSNVTNMQTVFRSCGSLTSLDVSNFVTLNVTNMANMFYGCNALTSLDVSNFDTSNVTSMANMFEGCKILTNLDISGFITSNVRDMGYMFYNCNALTSLDVSNWNTSNVMYMTNMFSGCNALTSLDVSGFITSKVIYMANMFSGCKILTSLDLSNWDTSSVTNMGAMFNNCNALTSLDVSGFITSKVTTMVYMFQNCNKLTSLDLSNWDTSSVTTMGAMFNGCNVLTSLDSMQNISTDLTLNNTKLDATSLIDVVNNLASVSSSKTLTLGSTLIAKLTEEQIAIATNKGWTVV